MRSPATLRDPPPSHRAASNLLRPVRGDVEKVIEFREHSELRARASRTGSWGCSGDDGDRRATHHSGPRGGSAHAQRCFRAPRGQSGGRLDLGRCRRTREGAHPAGVVGVLALRRLLEGPPRPAVAPDAPRDGCLPPSLGLALSQPRASGPYSPPFHTSLSSSCCVSPRSPSSSYVGSEMGEDARPFSQSRKQT